MIVKIYKPTKTAMQSGKANCKKWLLEFESTDSRFIDPIMGWTGNSDTKSQLRLKFDCPEDAIEYAKRQGLQYKVIEPKKPSVKIQSYSSTLM